MVPNVKLTLVRVKTNEKTMLTSKSDGSFDFSALTPDEYQLVAEAPGFKKATLDHIIVQVDQVSRMDLTLQPGDVTQSVEVEAAAPLVETETNTLANVVNQTAIQSMPLNSRNFTELALLTPGATPSAPGSQVTGFNVAGRGVRSQTFFCSMESPTWISRSTDRSKRFALTMRCRSSACRPVCRRRSLAAAWERR